MHGILKIGKPWIEKVNDSTVRLHAEIITKIGEETTTYDLWYEVDNEYAQYLCTERSDAFVVGVLPMALTKGLDIETDQPMSSRLFYQLTQHFIPIVSKFSNRYKKIETHAPITRDCLETARAVGTGISGGVDSFYTILRNHELDEATNNNVTHLTFFNVGSHGDFGGEYARELFRKRLVHAKKNASLMNLPLVSVDSNVSELLQMDFVQTHTFRNFSAVLALQKLFGVYYYSSAYDITDFQINPDDCAHFDLLTASNVSNEQVTFYSVGQEVSRIDKEKYISKYDIVKQRLNVCVISDNNCSHCEKCIRTMAGLYAIGELDNFKNVFDVDDFKKSYKKRMGFVIGNLSKIPYKEIYLEMRKSGIRIPMISFVYGAPKWIKERIRPIYENSEVLKKTWKIIMKR